MKQASQKAYIDQTAVGKGLFAGIDIRTGEIILTFEGPVVNSETAGELDLELYDRMMGNALQIDKDKYLYIKDPGRCANHSCDPNSGVKDDVYLVAIKDIPKGTEIVWDYSTSMDEDSWTMNCLCQDQRCRKIIKDFKYLPEEIRKRYLSLGIVQKFIARQYQKG